MRVFVDAIQVLPSEWGTARKPWFLFTTSYWCPGRANRAAVAENAKLLGHFESEHRDSVEPVEEGLRTQVQAGDCVAIRGKVLAEGAVCWQCTIRSTIIKPRFETVPHSGATNRAADCEREVSETDD